MTAFDNFTPWEFIQQPTRGKRMFVEGPTFQDPNCILQRENWSQKLLSSYISTCDDAE